MLRYFAIVLTLCMLAVSASAQTLVTPTPIPEGITIQEMSISVESGSLEYGSMTNLLASSSEDGYTNKLYSETGDLPEPGGLLALGSGLIGLIAFRRRLC